MGKLSMCMIICCSVLVFAIFATAGGLLIWAAREKDVETCSDWTFKSAHKGKICGTCGDDLVCQSQCPKTSVCFCDHGFFNYKCLNSTPSFDVAPGAAIGGGILTAVAGILLIIGVVILIYLLKDVYWDCDCCSWWKYSHSGSTTKEATPTPSKQEITPSIPATTDVEQGQQPQWTIDTVGNANTPAVTL